LLALSVVITYIAKAAQALKHQEAQTKISPLRHQDSKDGIKFQVLTKNSFLVTWCLGGEKGFC
jgi:hypothetical protein